MNVVGLDLSLTSTGVAVVTDRGRVAVGRVRSEGKRSDSIRARSERLDSIACEVFAQARLANLVVVERQIGQSTGSTHDRSGLWWQVVGELCRVPVPVVAVVPQHMKIYLTGRGTKVGKDETLAAAIKRYGHLVDLSNNDEAEALGLAAMGARHLGFPLEARRSLPQTHLRAMHQVDWTT